MNKAKELAKNIRLVIFDMDGVFTDGSMYFGNDGNEYKAFNSQDGHGIVTLIRTGIKVAIITGRKSQIVLSRANELGIEYVYQGYNDKLIAYHELKQTLNLEDAQIAYVGDDVVDLPVMLQVGLAIAVKNAHPSVKQHVQWRTRRKGGYGAVRDVCDFILSTATTVD
jgi:3-deoxy-D-manno-octulosonate 8-phosphate phosphatase (KDO 8-P phosphatase)